jgi:hypothetical protein
MQEARLGADDLGDVCEEGDDVVLHLALDLIDAVGVPGGVAALFPDDAGGFPGDHAQVGHGVCGVGLDLEHDLEARLRRPDRGGFLASVAGDHAARCASAPPAKSIAFRRSDRAEWGPPGRSAAYRL